MLERPTGRKTLVTWRAYRGKGRERLPRRPPPLGCLSSQGSKAPASWKRLTFFPRKAREPRRSTSSFDSFVGTGRGCCAFLRRSSVKDSYTGGCARIYIYRGGIRYCIPARPLLFNREPTLRIPPSRPRSANAFLQAEVGTGNRGKS